MIKIFSVSSAAILLSALWMSACSTEDTDGSGETKANTATSEQAVTTVNAGEAGKAKGVATWQFDGSNTVKALDAAGNVVAEFTVDEEAGVIRTTVPSLGTYFILAPNESDLLPETFEYIEAVKADFKEALDSANNAPVGGGSDVNKAEWTYACYQIYSDCSIQCLYGQVYGWWRNCYCQYPASECPNNPWRIGLRYN
jgi:hypothetical protein